MASFPPYAPATPVSESPEYLSEQEATRLWQRAAELQAEAARRAEARSSQEHALTAGTDEDDGDRTGYDLVHVRGAAVEAGIGEEFVDAALADIRAERAAAVVGPAGDRPISRWFLGDPPGSVTVRRTIQAEPRAVLSAMESVLPEPPFSLVLKDRSGDPANGGILTFDIPNASFTPSELQGFTMDASWADFRQVLASLRPLPGTPASTELTVRAPVAWAWRINALISGTISGGGGMVGAVLGFAVASAVTGGALPVMLVAGAVAAVGATGLSAMGMRAAYRYGLGKGERGLEGLASAVATRAQGGWGLTAGDPGAAAP